MKTTPFLDGEALVSKRLQSLFSCQNARPRWFTDVELTRLTPFQRALLVTDGTVTRFIETYTLSPVEITLLRQEAQKLPEGHIWLELPCDEEIVYREVLLQTPSTEGRAQHIHAYAVSEIVPHRLPKRVWDGVTTGKQGLGRLLLRSRLETHRELLWWGIERGISLPDVIKHLENEPFLSRTYRVVADRIPLMLITEKFPVQASVLENDR